MSDSNSEGSSAVGAISPGRLGAIQAEFLRNWNNLLAQARRGELPVPDDRRFRSEAWQSQPQALFSANAYLLMADTMRQLASSVDLGKSANERLQFAVMQWIEAFSPANFLVTNPEALQAMVRTGGESLQRGMANFLADLQRGRITQTDESAFAPGKNLAITEGSVIYENHLMQLIQYSPQSEEVHSRPLLMVPPCINKYYILDLQPESSLVRHALQAGFQVFMISWRNPRADDTDDSDKRSWDDYIEDGILRAIRAIRDISRLPQINALGFCVGGTMLATALAVARARDQDPVASLTLLTTFLDFGETGIIDVFVDEWHARARENQLGQGGLMTAAELGTTFSYLRPAELVWNYVESNYLMGETPRAFDLLSWNSDGTNLPGPYFAWYFRNMYLENKLVSGRLQVCGEQLDLQRLDMPCYLYASREDHIVPWASAYASTLYLPGQLRFVLGESGHIAGVINPPAKNKRGYWTGADSTLPSDAATWLESADHQQGSWWPDWLQWLAAHSGAMRKPRKSLGNRNYPIIEPAPGRYVKVKAD